MIHAVLSHYQTSPLLAAREKTGAVLDVSLDLNLTVTPGVIETEGVRFPERPLVPWSELERVSADEIGCYVWNDEGLEKIQSYSEQTNRYYVLMATAKAPTLLNSGIPMHRIKEIDPQGDTKAKIRSIGPIFGNVLDTSMGLGYTAIASAKKAEHVTTIEVDPVVVEVARLNPWSRGLFESPNITRVLGDAYDAIEKFDDRSFSRIIHDPPMFSLAGHLYSAAFYRQLHRVLRSGGLLFHYIGNLESKRGRNLARGVRTRLRDSGFADVWDRRNAFGLVARK